MSSGLVLIDADGFTVTARRICGAICASVTATDAWKTPEKQTSTKMQSSQAISNADLTLVRYEKMAAESYSLYERKMMIQTSE